MRNVVKNSKYSPMKFARFEYVCITRGKRLPFSQKFQHVIQIHTKSGNFIGAIFLPPNFLTVAKDLPRSKIRSIMQIAINKARSDQV